jgi:two-component system response regulator MprA
MKIRMVIIHDARHGITSLKRLLMQEGYDIVSLPLKIDVPKNTIQSAADLVLLDVPSLEHDHLEIVGQLRLSNPQLPIVVLTRHTSSMNVIKGFEVGIDDCLIMPVPSQELIARLKALLRRRAQIQHEILRYSDIELDTLTRQIAYGDYTYLSNYCVTTDYGYQESWSPWRLEWLKVAGNL